MNLLYRHDETVARFVADHIPGCERGFEHFTAIGVIDDAGHLVGGIVYHDWSPEHGVIEMSSAATTPRWFTRKILQAMFELPFDRLGCQMVVTRMAESNTGLHSQFERLGFRRHSIPRLYGRDEAGIIYTMTDDDWKASRFMRR